MLDKTPNPGPAINSKKNIFYLTGALIIYLICAFHSIGYYHVDEYYQILDFASYKAGNPLISANSLMWEYHAHIRPSLQVFLAYCTINAATFIGIKDPFSIYTTLRIFSSLLSLFCLVCLYKAFRKELYTRFASNVCLILCLTLWFLPYLSARYSSETWSGAIFFIALSYLLSRPSHTSIYRYFITGLMLGLAFNFRFQCGFLIFGLFAWFLLLNQGYKKPGLYAMALGLVIMIGLGICLDYWLYNEWTFSAFQYFKANIIDDKASQYGTMPWYSYFELLFSKSGPFALLIIVSMLVLWIKKPKHMLTWVSLPFVLAHIIIAHKELRFLFPLAFMLPLVIAFMSQEAYFGFMQKKWAISAFMLLNTPLLLFWMFAPSAVPLRALEEAYYNGTNQKTKIYYTHSNPYCLAPGYRFSFFMMPLKETYGIEKLQNIREVASKDYKEVILYTDKLNLDEKDSLPGIECKLVWQTLPQFLTKMNLFNWVDRTHLDCIYVCRKKENNLSQYDSR